MSKREEIAAVADGLRAGQTDAPVKLLTSCPSCLQGLSRYEDETGIEGDYIVVEKAKNLLCEDWMNAFIKRVNEGGMEKVLL